jgi:heptosyltransferase-2
MSQPAIADLRRALPEAGITIAARPAFTPLFALFPQVDETIAQVDLGRGSFDAAVLLPNSFRSALLAFRAGIPQRWGYRTGRRRPLLTKAIAPVDGVHQAEAYQRLVAALGYDVIPSTPRLDVPDAVREEGRRELAAAGWDGAAPLVALAPGAAYGGAKRWPPASFAAVAERLEQDGARIVLVGSRGDARTGQELLHALGGRAVIINLIGSNDVRGLAGVLAHCRALVSNDSGAMHIGAAIGLPVTAPFGPTDERQTRPLGDRHHVITHPVWCRPCMLRECPLDHQCMRGIPAEAVAEAARHSLS